MEAQAILYFIVYVHSVVWEVRGLMISWYDRSGGGLVMLGSGSLSVIIELSEARN